MFVKNIRSKKNKKLTGDRTRIVWAIWKTTLELTLPVTDALLKTRRKSWIQLAGHPGSVGPVGPNTIWKRIPTEDHHESRAYRAIMEDDAHTIVPLFQREVEYNGKRILQISNDFIEMENLLQRFNDPSIMDIKMGTRTFLESEVQKPGLRTDLYEKMVELDSSAPTDEEQNQQAITKLRYMQFREQESSTQELGFRIDAVRISGESTNTNLKNVKTREQITSVLATFLKENKDIGSSLLKRLLEIRNIFESSTFFMTHEVIGSSLLVIYDQTGNCGVWAIDFSKTLPLQNGKKLTHREPWSIGNREDGFLTGLDNIIKIWEGLFDSSGENKLSS